MSESIPLSPEPCALHPDTPSSRPCGLCQRPSCADCLVGIGGKEVCVHCKDEALRNLLSGVPASGATEAPWHPVGTFKFCLMSVLTLSTYEAWWTYGCWKRYRERTGEDLSPFWRTIFMNFYLHRFFTELERESGEAGVPASYPKGWLVAAFWALTLSGRAPGAIAFLSVFTFVPLLPAVRQIQRLNEKLAPDAPRNSRLTWKNGVGVALVWTCYLFIFFGAFFLEQQKGQ